MCVGNLFTVTKRNLDHLHDNPRFEFMRHDFTLPLYFEVDEFYSLGLSGITHQLPAPSRSNDQDIGLRRDQHAGPG